MDIAEILDITAPIEINWLSHKVTAHVYTIGRERLTKEERKILNKLNEGKNADDPMTYDETVEWARTTIPIMLAGWDLDGSPMTLKGVPFPPTAENATHLPDGLVVSVATVAAEVWVKANPTDGDGSPISSEQAEKPELSQIETTSP